MLSAVIRDSQPTRSDQLTLDFTPGLTDRFRDLRECVAAGIYQRGLGRIAIDLNKAPGNLSVELSEDPTRKFSVEALETYIEKTGDTQPIMYLVEKFLAPDARPKNHEKVKALQAQAAELLREIQSLGAA